jgi:NAD+ synthase
MNWQDEFDKIAEWMKNYAENAGIKRFVIGLSGGIDSSVAACLAAKAVGLEGVVGVTMPCDSSTDAENDAKKLAENLKIPFYTKSIEAAYTIFRSSLVDHEGKIDNLVQANLKARLRMVMLYGIANKNNALVVGTGNFSELTVGYFTKFGDGGVDIEPLGNFLKTEVYELAKCCPEIPQSVIEKPPSADLWAGQTDEEELGMSYEELDNIINKLNGKSIFFSSKERINKCKVEKMFQAAAHKNHPPPRYIRHRGGFLDA